MAGLIFYMHDGPATFRFELAGNLAGAEVAKLDQAWRTASSTTDGKAVAVDVTYLAEVDETGRDLLFRWWREWAHLIASSARSRTLVESITGGIYESPDDRVGPAFYPRFTSGSLRVVLFAFVLGVSLFLPSTASAFAGTEVATNVTQ
jgi:ABC-type transporter Mla MlaB component